VLASARGAQGLDVVECRAKPVLLDLKVVAGLQVYPEPLRGAEVAGVPQGRVSADPALPVDDLVDPPGRHTYRLGQLILAHPERPEELAGRGFQGITCEGNVPPLGGGEEAEVFSGPCRQVLPAGRLLPASKKP